MRSCSLAVASGCLVLIVASSRADAPRTVPFQAVVKTQNGTLANSPVSVTFTFYDAQGNAAGFSETKSLTPVNGVVSTQLGGSTTGGIGLTFSQPYTVGVKLGSDAEMTPRIPLASVPYALFAQTVADNAVTPASLSAGDYSAKINAGSYNINATGLSSRADARTGLKPDDVPLASANAYFGTFTNNGVSPFADVLAFNTWTDASGGRTNALFLSKSDIGMRIYQGDAGATSAMTSYKDVAMLGDPANFGATTVNGPLQITGAGSGLKFADGTTQSTAQLAGPQGPTGATGATGAMGATGPQGPEGPYPGTRYGFSSGLDNTFTLTYALDGTDITKTGAVLAAPFQSQIPVTYNPASGPTVPTPAGLPELSSVALRRPRAADNTWATMARNAGAPTYHTLTITLAGGAKTTPYCQWTFTHAFASAYTLVLADDGLPMEELELLPDAFTRTQTNTAWAVEVAGVAPHQGFVTHQPATNTYRLTSIGSTNLISNAASPCVVVSDTGYKWVVAASGGGAPSYAFRNTTPLTVRDNAANRSDLYNWFNAAVTETSGGTVANQNFQVRLQSARPGPPVPVNYMLVAGVNGLPDSYSLYLADDGLPVEDYEIVHNGLTITTQ